MSSRLDAELALHVAQQVEDLRLHRHVQRRRRLVGNDERRPAGQRDGDHHALPHAARQLVRVVVDALLGIGDAHRAQQLDRTSRAPPCVPASPCTRSASAIWAPTRITGLSAAIGSWKTKPMPAPRTCRISSSGRGQQIAALEQDAPAGDPPGRLHQADDRERGDRLAAAGFADQPQRLAAADLEGHVVHRPRSRGPRRTCRTRVREALDRQQQRQTSTRPLLGTRRTRRAACRRSRRRWRGPRRPR